MSQQSPYRHSRARTVGKRARQVSSGVKRTVTDRDPGRSFRRGIQRQSMHQRESGSEPDGGPGEIEIAVEGMPNREAEDHRACREDGISHRHRDPPIRRA
jgi:hypothetical protein